MVKASCGSGDRTTAATVCRAPALRRGFCRRHAQRPILWRAAEPRILPGAAPHARVRDWRCAWYRRCQASEQGQSRRVVLTVPNFMMALVQLAEIDLVATLPRHLVARHAGRFNLTTCPVPLPWKPDPVRVLASKAAMADAGIAWLFETMERCMGVSLKARAAERRRARGIMGNI